MSTSGPSAHDHRHLRSPSQIPTHNLSYDSILNPCRQFSPDVHADGARRQRKRHQRRLLHFPVARHLMQGRVEPQSPDCRQCGRIRAHQIGYCLRSPPDLDVRVAHCDSQGLVVISHPGFPVLWCPLRAPRERRLPLCSEIQGSHPGAGDIGSRILRHLLCTGS